MEPKRRRLENDTPSSSSSHLITKRPRKFRESELTNFCVKDLQSPELFVISAALIRLKKILASKDAVEFFVDDERCPELLKELLILFDKSADEISKPDILRIEILKEIVSIIGNCCYISTAACLEVKRPKVNFNHHAVRILESSRTSAELKASMLRAVGNMSAHKESALVIANHSSLVDRIAILLDDENDSVHKMALRTIRLLVQASFSKIVLLSNAGFYLGRLLVRDVEERLWKDIVFTLTCLVRQSVRDIGRQLAGSECSAQLSKLFFFNDHAGARSLVSSLCDGSTDIRDRLGGEEKIIEKIVKDIGDLEDGCSPAHCRLLLSFAQDAWGRASLRESGALELLVTRLSRTTDLKERLLIVTSFRHYIHDRIGLAHLCRSTLFTNTVVKHVKEYLEENGVECSPKLRTDDDLFRPNSPLLLEIESKLQQEKQETTEQENSHALYKDFSSMWAYGGSPSPPTRNNSFSLLSSSSSSGQLSPSSGDSSPTRSIENYAFDEQSSIGTSPILRLNKDDGEDSRTHKQCIENELWLWAWQTQEDSNLPYLIREDVVVSLLAYLRTAPSVHSRVGKALRRMASSRTSVDALLKIQFHIRVMNQLCAAPCRMTRYAKRCNRCEKSAEFGREILREFSLHVGSDFGQAFLRKQLSSNFETENIQAAISRVALVRDRFAATSRIARDYGNAVENVLNILKRLMKGEHFERDAEESTYAGGPPLCVQIIGALSTLIPTQRIREVFELYASWRPAEYVPCQVIKENEKTNVQTLQFCDTHKNVLVEVPKAAVCSNSEYFRGMFSSDLLEKREDRRIFVFDEEKESCSCSDFIKFLHYLSGCRNDNCTPINSTETCMALKQLSDRYLCSTLSEQMFSAYGPARRLLNGRNVAEFFKIGFHIYTSHKLVDSSFMTLMRYALADDIIRCLLSISSEGEEFVDLFIEHLSLFIQNNKDSNIG